VMVVPQEQGVVDAVYLCTYIFFVVAIHVNCVLPQDNTR
jgi:hypothetical protein